MYSTKGRVEAVAWLGAMGRDILERQGWRGTCPRALGHR